MQINKAIRKIMKDSGVSLNDMALAIGKKQGSDISARLVNPNLTFDVIIEMLNALGYEVVLQEKRDDHDDGQIVVDQIEEDEQLMKSRDAVKYIMDRLGITNVELANRLYISQQSLWDRLNSKKTNDLSVSVLNEMLKAMDYKIVIMPKDEEVSGNSFTIEQ